MDCAYYLRMLAFLLATPLPLMACTAETSAHESRDKFLGDTVGGLNPPTHPFGGVLQRNHRSLCQGCFVGADRFLTAAHCVVGFRAFIEEGYFQVYVPSIARFVTANSFHLASNERRDTTKHVPRDIAIVITDAVTELESFARPTTETIAQDLEYLPHISGDPSDGAAGLPRRSILSAMRDGQPGPGMLLSAPRHVYGRLSPSATASSGTGWGTRFHESDVLYAQAPIDEKLTESGDSGACVFTENADGTLGITVVGVHVGRAILIRSDPWDDVGASAYHELGDLTDTEALGGLLRSAGSPEEYASFR